MGQPVVWTKSKSSLILKITSLLSREICWTCRMHVLHNMFYRHMEVVEKNTLESCFNAVRTSFTNINVQNVYNKLISPSGFAIIFLMCLLITGIFLNTENILVAVGQDPYISKCVWAINGHIICHNSVPRFTQNYMTTYIPGIFVSTLVGALCYYKQNIVFLRL